MKAPASMLVTAIASTLVLTPAQAAPAVATPRQAGGALQQIVKPQARERWTALITRGLTPERVEDILRGAFGGDMVAQWELFDLMEDTWPRLKKLLNEIKEAVQRKSFTVDAYKPDDAKEPSDIAKKKAALVRAAMYGCQPDPTRAENGWEEMLYDLCDAFGKGTSIQEILWAPAIVEKKSAILPRAFRWVSPIHYGYPWTDPNDDRLMLSPEANQADWIEFPPDKFIIANFRTKTGHPLGGALLRSLATFWIGANFSYEWALNLAQLFGIPIRWANYDPTNAGSLDDICDMLENLGSAGWGAFPAGTTLELKEALQRAADNPQAFVLQLADTAADLLILGQTLTSDAGNHGTQALGTVHMSVREQRILYVATWAAQTLSYQFVGPLMRLNFGNNDEDPCIEVEVNEVEDAGKMAERDRVLIKELGMPVKRSWLYERHDIPEPEDGDDIFEPTASASETTGGTGAGGRTGAGGLPDQKLKQPATRQPVHAKAADLSATDKLTENVLENLTSVEAKWLAGVRPIFAGLMAKAKDSTVTDAELVTAIEAAARQFPDLFGRLDTAALRTAMEQAMAAALVNGVARGVSRRAGTRQEGVIV